jgi:mono/diheme cytochrome c family protein
MNAHGASMGPSLVGVESGDVREAVLYGEDKGMPSFKNNLCANDIANLTAYLQLLGTGTEPTFTNWWENGMPSK